MSAPSPVQGIVGLREAFAGRRVLLTGHTGFKGGWLATWLQSLGASVVGVALPPPAGQPSLFDAVGVADFVDHRIADIGDAAAYRAAVRDVDAELVIHMAAQALVRPSYAMPVETLRTNVLGTAIVLEAARDMPSLRGVVVVTSDKCYDNVEWVWGYRENDPMGGHDPYSASKGCAELVVNAWRHSFLAAGDAPLLASVRAGNVFGGGDWSVDRLIPDIVRAARDRTPVTMRNPDSVRPWQHVLEPLYGYLLLAARLLDGDRGAAGPWNFGPDTDAIVTVRTLANAIRRSWGPGAPDIRMADGIRLAEANILRLDSTKAKAGLGWHPRLTLHQAIDWTVDWYRAFLGGGDMRALTLAQIADFTRLDDSPAKPDPARYTMEESQCA